MAVRGGPFPIPRQVAEAHKLREKLGANPCDAAEKLMREDRPVEALELALEVHLLKLECIEVWQQLPPDLPLRPPMQSKFCIARRPGSKAVAKLVQGRLLAALVGDVTWARAGSLSK
jgi:hypothetical protein